MLEIISTLEQLAHPSLQESYDNAGLIVGDPSWECRGVLCALDATEKVVEEAVRKNCNLIVAHHPIIFSGLKRITGKNYVEKSVITAIRNEVAIYAIHTNLDNVVDGVNGRMAATIGLTGLKMLDPKPATLKKLYTFVPVRQAETVREALFGAGGGQIGRYSECSFSVEGEGTFRAGIDTNPFVGEIGSRHREREVKVEVVFPAFLESQVVGAMKAAHPYEEVAFDVVALANPHLGMGSGLVGEFAEPMDERQFLVLLREKFRAEGIRHSPLPGKPIRRVAICGGAGSFLINKALACGADAFVTSDLKYHEFFDANDRLLLADIGHYESEQFTINLLQEHLAEKFPTFAVLKTTVETNPVRYFR